MTATMTTSGAVAFKAGKNRNASIASGANESRVDQWINEAESLINNATRINYTNSYSGLNADVKNTLNETASNLAAIYMIQYDMSGYTTRIEAEDMVVILRDAVLRNISILRDKKTTTFINGA